MAARKKAAPKKPAAVAPQFTAAQQRVIDHRMGPMLAGAVAGSGKSTSLVERVAKLVGSGVPMHRIMLSAFNVDASEQLNRKIRKRLNLKATEVEVARTLHSLAHAIWRSSPSSEGIGLDRGGSMYGRAIRQGASALGVTVFEPSLVIKLASKLKNDLLVTSFTEGLRALGQTPSILTEAAEEIVRANKNSPMSAALVLDLYFAAETARREGTGMPDGTVSKFCGFDDLLVEAARLLNENDEARALWQGRFDYVIIDEAQDLCEAQWSIANALAGGHNNIMIVGDVAQAIYSFRQAKPANFLSFPESWPHTQSVYMQENFRSGHEIVRVSNIVLDSIPNDQKLPMKIICTRDAAGFVGYRLTDDPWSEAADIAENILKHRDSGIDWRDQAILVRRNDQSAALELELLRAKVPARIVRGHSFFASRECKVTLAYFRLIANRADKDDFEQAILNPPKYLGRAYVDKITLARTDDVDWLDVMDASPVTGERRYESNARNFIASVHEWRALFQKGRTPYQIFTAIRRAPGWQKWTDDGTEAVADNDSQMNFERVLDFLSGYDSVGAMLDTVAELKAAQRAAAASRNAVSIATAHGFKGLEAQIVYVAGMVDGVWPVNWGGMADERRVFYVAVTRARDELWFSGYRFSGDSKDARSSPYLDELGIGEPTERIGRQTVAAGQMSLLGG